MDSLTSLLAQNVSITNWLTPVWMISVGISIGFAFTLLMLFKFWFVSKIPGLNTINDNPKVKIVVGVILAVIYFGLLAWAYHWLYEPTEFTQDMILPIMFAVPLCLLIGIGVWALVAKSKFVEVWGLFTEGFLGWMNLICFAAITIAVSGFVLAHFNGFGFLKLCDDPMGMMNSLGRIPFVGEYQSDEIIVPPSASRHIGDSIPVDFYGQEVGFIQFKSDQELEVCAIPISPRIPPQMMFFIPEDSYDKPLRAFRRGTTVQKLPEVHQTVMYVNNRGDEDARVQITWSLIPVYAQVWLIPFVAIGFLAIYLLYLVMAVSFPKVAAIALSTFKTEISQPLFLIVMLIGFIFIIGSVYVPYNTFGEDIKMYKDSGLTLIRVLGIFLAIWAASKSVAEEIEGRTALTVLSKPVGRRQFILGKFSGISLAVALMFITLGIWFVIWTAYKPIYDGREASQGVIEWETCFVECVHIIPGLFLCFLEVTIFVAISVAISTRMGTLANFLICFSIYVLGHLTPLIAQSNFAAFEPVVVFSQLISIVFPVLDHFDVQAAINTNRPVPVVYLGWSIIYTTLYGAIAMLLALVLFEDRDLA